MIMAKFPEAQARLFKNVFVCLKCKHKIKGSPVQVKLGEFKCRKCVSHQLSPTRREKTG